jgi:hypothetical protein
MRFPTTTTTTTRATSERRNPRSSGGTKPPGNQEKEQEMTEYDEVTERAYDDLEDLVRRGEPLLGRLADVINGRSTGATEWTAEAQFLSENLAKINSAAIALRRQLK